MKVHGLVLVLAFLQAGLLLLWGVALAVSFAKCGELVAGGLSFCVQPSVVV